MPRGRATPAYLASAAPVREEVHDRQVRGQPGDVVEVVASQPAQLVVVLDGGRHARGHASQPHGHGEGLTEGPPPAGERPTHLLAQLDLDAELLAHLAVQGFLRGLPRVNLAAGELPAARE